MITPTDVMLTGIWNFVVIRSAHMCQYAIFKDTKALQFYNDILVQLITLHIIVYAKLFFESY